MFVQGIAGRVGLMCALVLAVALVLPGLAEAQNCARPKEQKALNTRLLQTELMVAALVCQKQQNYNDFILKFQTQLVQQGKSLRSLYQRLHGGAANKKLNALVTRLANGASQRSNQQYVGFCRQAQLLFDEAKSADTAGFDALVAKAAGLQDPGTPPCGGANVVGYGANGKVVNR